MKFLFFPNGWVLAHPSRMIEVAKVLRSRGHEVAFAGEHEHPRSYLFTCREEGFRTVRCREFDWPFVWDRYLKYGSLVTAYDLITHRKFAPLDLILDDQVQVIRRERPDLVVADGTFSLSNAAYITQTPMAGIMNGYYAHFYDPGTVYRPVLQTVDRFHLSRLRNRVYRAHGCKPVNAVALLQSVKLISPGLEELDHYTKKYPNWEAVGPIWGRLPFHRPPWLDSLADGRPNVYITMGSTGNLDQFLRRVFPALGSSRYRYIVTGGKQLSEATRNLAPENFLIADYAPGDEILRRCKALIFHGGNGSMYQALAAGVPMIALPHTLEQAVNVRLGLKHGFSKRLRPALVTGEKLLRTLDEVVENRAYAAAAGLFAELIRRTNGAKRAAEIILEVADRGDPPRVGVDEA